MSIKTLLYGLGLGAGAMYVFDPQRGNRRRALLRDQAIRTLNRTDSTIDKGTRDLSNRASGMIAEAKNLLSGQEVTDDQLAQRVRSKIGRTVSHPRALRITAQGGRITLSGPILTADVAPLMAVVNRVRGVKGVENQLEVHEEPGDVPALQGEPAQTARERSGEGWTPGLRLLGSVAGSLITLGGWRRGGIIGTARSFIGLALIARSVTNRGLGHLIGVSGQPGAVTVHKGIKINAAVEDVFRFWQNYDNFALFMSNVLEVKDTGEGKSHWKVNGPAGTPVEWDAVITNLVPNQLLAWESVPGSMVQQSGLVRFAEAQEGGTHLNVQMSYTPPAGVIGHAVASFFGVNPKQAMDEDLLRVKSLIENNKTLVEDRPQARRRSKQRAPAGGSGRRGEVTAEDLKAAVAEDRDNTLGVGWGKVESHENLPHPEQAPAVPHGEIPTVSGVNLPPASKPGSNVPDQEESGMPGGGAGRVDEVGPTNVYPASGPLPEGDAEVRDMASWGQGERGAAGYEDHGESELTGLGEETDLGSVIPGTPDEPGFS